MATMPVKPPSPKMKNQRTSGRPLTSAARQNRWRERIRNAGLKRVQLVVPTDRVEEIRAIAARMVKDET